MGFFFAVFFAAAFFAGDFVAVFNVFFAETFFPGAFFAGAFFAADFFVAFLLDAFFAAFFVAIVLPPNSKRQQHSFNVASTPNRIQTQSLPPPSSPHQNPNKRYQRGRSNQSRSIDRNGTSSHTSDYIIAG